jgi:hypothetical protein
MLKKSLQDTHDLACLLVRCARCQGDTVGERGDA